METYGQDLFAVSDGGRGGGVPPPPHHSHERPQGADPDRDGRRERRPSLSGRKREGLRPSRALPGLHKPFLVRKGKGGERRAAARPAKTGRRACGGSEKRCAVRCLGGEVLQPLFQHELRLGDILRIIDVNDVKAAGIDVETVVAIGARRRFRVPDALLREHRFCL